MEVVPRRKLIEVGLPLDAINRAAAREKAVRRGHPRNLHPWWGRRPSAAARAVIFAHAECGTPVGRPSPQRHVEHGLDTSSPWAWVVDLQSPCQGGRGSRQSRNRPGRRWT